MKVAVISARFYTRLHKSKIDQSGPLEERTLPVRAFSRIIFEFSRCINDNMKFTNKQK